MRSAVTRDFSEISMKVGTARVVVSFAGHVLRRLDKDRGVGATSDIVTIGRRGRTTRGGKRMTQFQRKREGRVKSLGVKARGPPRRISAHTSDERFLVSELGHDPVRRLTVYFEDHKETRPRR